MNYILLHPSQKHKYLSVFKTLILLCTTHRFMALQSTYPKGEHSDVYIFAYIQRCNLLFPILFTVLMVLINCVYCHPNDPRDFQIDPQPLVSIVEYIDTMHVALFK